MQRLLLAFSLLLCFFKYASGQDELPPPVTLETPYNTVYVHLYYLQPDSYQPALAARTLYQPGDSARAVRLAIMLKEVLDGKGLYVNLDEVPDVPDWTDSVSQKPIYKLFPKLLPDVYLERIDGKWYYSAHTVRSIPKLHKEVYPWGTDALLRLVPTQLGFKFLGLHAWQWLGIAILLLGAWLLHWVLSRALRPVVRLLSRSRFSQPLQDKEKIFTIARRASLVVVGVVLLQMLPMLKLPVLTMAWLLRGVQIGVVVLVTMLLMSIIDIVRIYAERFAMSTESKLDEQLLPILYRGLQVLVVISAIIYILSLLRVNVAALIAGVSIGGLALALAAQDTVKNLIGSAMIFFDQPFQIGDWIVMSGIEGEVVEVGFRSTRLRTQDSSLVSIPNNEIASAAITNMGVRQYRMFKATLGVTYDTPPALLEQFILGLRKMIESHPLTKKDNFLVYFHSFGDSSLNIYFRCHIAVKTFQEELQEREKLAFGILTLANHLGVRFAFPTSTIFVEEFPGNGSTTPEYDINPDHMEKRTEEMLAQWRRKWLEGQQTEN